MPKDTTYNGWKNRQTWSCALWIDNDEGLYHAARDFMLRHQASKAPYANFIRLMGLENDKNGDGYKWLSTRICYPEMNEYMRDLVR